MDKKGQALVEFIIIIPIIIIILMAISDFVMIFNHKSTLENNMTEVIKIYQKTKNEEEIKKYLNTSNLQIKYSKKIEDKYTKITLTKEYEFITPGLGALLSSPYEIKEERVILSE